MKTQAKDMKSIDADIKANQLQNVYLLYGEERYLLLQYRDKLVNALTGYDDTMNFTHYEGDSTTEESIIDMAETLPFFADFRVILIENSGLFKGSCDKLAAYMENIPSTTYLIFCESAADGRYNLKKAIDKYGSAIEFHRLDSGMLRRWVLSRIKKENKNITDEAYEMFISRTGNDMALIDTELEKLFCYTMGKDAIYPEDIAMLTSRQISDQVFEMIDAVVSRNRKKAFELYYDLLALKVPPVKTLSLIGRQYRMLISVKSMTNSGKSNGEIAKQLKVWDSLVGKYQAQARRYSMDELKEILEYIDELDHSFKTSALSDQMAVEMFLIKYS